MGDCTLSHRSRHPRRGLRVENHPDCSRNAGLDCESPSNEAVAQSARNVGLNVTTFWPAAPDAAESLLAVLPDVGLHHGPDSQQVPYRSVHVYDLSISNELRDALRGIGFGNVRRMCGGFAAEVLAAANARYLGEDSAKAAAEFIPFVQRYFRWLKRAVEHAADDAQLRDLPSNIGGDDADSQDTDVDKKSEPSWEVARRASAQLGVIGLLEPIRRHYE